MGKIIIGKGTRQRTPVSTEQVAMEVITIEKQPTIQTVEVIKEVVREVIVEKIIEVPVEKIVEVPVEKIVTEIKEVTIEKIVEVQIPVERIVVQDRVEYIEIPMDLSRIRELETKLKSADRAKYLACAVAVIALCIVGVLV